MLTEELRDDLKALGYICDRCGAYIGIGTRNRSYCSKACATAHGVEWISDKQFSAKEAHRAAKRLQAS